MPSQDVRYLVFDIECIADGNLISRVKFASENYSPAEAINAYREELVERYDTEFIPQSYHLPVSVAIIKLDGQLNILDLVTLDSPEYRPHVITKHFWQGWKHYGMPTFVSFNGRSYDIPVMELAAYRYGIGIPEWFNLGERTYEQKRNRYNQFAHFDLQDILTNFGAVRFFTGGLNLASKLLGRPGKFGVAGEMVQEMYDNGQIEEINDYCRCDVLDTYFVFLRTKVLTGEFTLDEEKALVEKAQLWLEEKSKERPVYGEYLEHCSAWENPWQE